MTVTPADPALHLWEVDHPFRAPTALVEDCPSFTRLQERVEQFDADLNPVLRWDWFRWADEIHDSRFRTGEDRTGQEFWLYLLQLHHSDGPQIIAFTSPIDETLEDTAREWLRGERVLGPLVDVWAPILGTYEYDQG